MNHVVLEMKTTKMRGYAENMFMFWKRVGAITNFPFKQLKHGIEVKVKTKNKNLIHLYQFADMTR